MTHIQRNLQRTERLWARLAGLWALYYLAIFTLGTNPQYMQKTIWMGMGLVGLFTGPLFMRHVRFRHIPREGVLLILFWVWALAGWFFATEMTLFVRYMKLVMELVLITISVSLILERSGGAKWFYAAFLAVAVQQVVFGENPIGMDQIASSEVTMGRIEGANGIGFHCVLGILGALALWREPRGIWLRLVLVLGGGLALYGVVLSASRGAFVTLIATVILWSTLCLVGGSRLKIKAVIGAIVIILLAYWTYQFILQNTYMGVRFTNATQLEDGSSQMRFSLFLVGGKIFAANPLFGCGLGQFGAASGTGYYAHNEFVEIAASTGLPGLFFYYSVYVVAWRRLSWSLRHLSDPLVRYHTNIARMILLVLLVAGALTRPNFIAQNTMFLLGVSVGVAHWAEKMAWRACRQNNAASGLVPVPNRIQPWSSVGFASTGPSRPVAFEFGHLAEGKGSPI